MEYFNHDTTAGGDDKIIALRLAHGGAAVDAYWSILEQIYRDETALDFEKNQHLTRSVCHRLIIDEKTLQIWISTMLEIGLFKKDEKSGAGITSERAMENIAAYHKKAEIARQNGKSGGRKPKKKPTVNRTGNQSETDSETQTKANKNKIKDIGLHKVNQISLGESAASAASAAPLSQQKCPFCETPLWKNTQTGKWHCDGCLESFTREQVAA